MNENPQSAAKPSLWLIDSQRAPLKNVAAEAGDVFTCTYLGEDWEVRRPDNPPDAILVAAEIRGGANGNAFGKLLDFAQSAPVLVVTSLRSLAQAVAFFRAGAADYLSLPLDKAVLLERLDAALRRAEQSAMRDWVMQLEPVDADIGDLTLSLTPAESGRTRADDDDILAQLPGGDAAGGGGGFSSKEAPSEAATSTPPNEATQPNDAAQPKPEDSAPDEPKPDEPKPDEPKPDEPKPDEPKPDEPKPDEPKPNEPEADEPEVVDGLPIPSLWEELPCGLLVFDSAGNMVFANRLGLELFGFPTLAELQEVLENDRGRFAAHGANLRPLPDNQWPQVLAQKSRMARSAVLSIEKPDRRRTWIRIDCLPHLHDGKITRLSMTIVNLTGELPPFNPRGETAAPPAGKRDKRGRRRR